MVPGPKQKIRRCRGQGAPPAATARFLTFIVLIKDAVGRYVMGYRFSPTTWFLGIRFRSLGLCPAPVPTEPPPRPHHCHLMKPVADVIISENPGPRWNRVTSGKAQVEETQAQRVGVSVTVGPLVIAGTGLCGAVICKFAKLFLHQMVSEDYVYRI